MERLEEIMWSCILEEYLECIYWELQLDIKENSRLDMSWFGLLENQSRCRSSWQILRELTWWLRVFQFLWGTWRSLGALFIVLVSFSSWWSQQNVYRNKMVMFWKVEKWIRWENIIFLWKKYFHNRFSNEKNWCSMHIDGVWGHV